MSFIFEYLFWFSILVIGYVYIGYPFFITLLNLIIKKPILKDNNYFPFISFIISAYNEEEIIRQKIENTLSLDYPENKLEIIIISDCSTDRTDEIIYEYEPKRLKLIRNEKRLGKSLGLNKGVEMARGEIIVFSDANTIYETNSLRKIVRNFASDEIGYVTGEARYIKNNIPASEIENKYWGYEIYLKKQETSIGSMVGGDGAIYAIRKDLFRPLKGNDINDFLVPLQIIRKGYRGIYEPQAIAYEASTGNFQAEFVRKRRIISRSIRSILSVPDILNPFKTGGFALQLISHKFLRWLIPFFMIILFICSCILSFNNIFFKCVLTFQLFFYSIVILAHFIKKLNFKSTIFYFPYYFIIVNLASFLGVLDACRKKVPAMWQPFRLSEKEDELHLTNKNIDFYIFLICFVILVLSTLLFKIAALILFWFCCFLVFYVYILYPILITLLTKKEIKNFNIKNNSPSVTLLITAYNEEKVIRQKIENSLKIDYPKKLFSIVVSSDGSNDKTNQIVSEFKQVKLYQFDKRMGKISTINRVVPKLHSDIVVFSDANVIYEKDTVKRLVTHFQNPKVGGVSGDVILINDNNLCRNGESLYYKYERYIQLQESKYYSMIGADGAMYAIRRSLFSTTFDNIILDDFVIPMRIIKNGYQFIFEPKAKGFESSPDNWTQEFKRRVRITAGAIQAVKLRVGLPNLNQPKLLFEYISHKLFRWVLPFLFLLILTSNFSLLSINYFYLIFFTLQILLIITSLFGMTSNKISGIISIPFYFLMVNIASFVGIFKGLLNLQKSTWELAER